MTNFSEIRNSEKNLFVTVIDKNYKNHIIFVNCRKPSDPPRRGRSSPFWRHIININMKNIFEKKQFYKIRFVSYSCKSVMIFRFLIEDGKKKVAKKERFFCHCNLIKFYTESKLLIFPIVQIVNIFIKFPKNDIFHSPRSHTLMQKLIHVSLLLSMF